MTTAEPLSGAGLARLGMPVESARTPSRPRDRVLALFTCGANQSWLAQRLASELPAGPIREAALEDLPDAARAWAAGDGRALVLLQSDALARRGAARPALDAWAELRRINRAFFEERVANARLEAARSAAGDPGSPGHRPPELPRDGVSEDDEPFHVRMFAADSLRPPGLEHLNTVPLFELREDQNSYRLPRGSRPARPDSTALGSGGRQPIERFGPPQPQILRRDAVREDLSREAEPIGGSDSDEAWRRGDPNRTPDEAVAEYWGDSRASSDTAIGAPEVMGRAFGDSTAWGRGWSTGTGPRFMRYSSIPFWQKGGREGVEYDIEETLGTQARELDSSVRRWDLGRVRDPQGQDYRRYGRRSGHAV